MTRDLETLQTDVERERRQLEHSLSALTDRMSVDALSSEAGQHINAMTGDAITKLMARFGRSAQAHPLATAAVGAGLSWLLSDPARGPLAAASASASPSASSPAPTPVRRSMGAYNGPKPAEGDPNLNTPVSVAAHSSLREPDVVERVQQKASDAMATATDAADAVRDKAHQLRERLGEGTQELSQEARDRVIAAREKALIAAQSGQQKLREAGKTSRDFASENPMVVGGVALAIGAAVAGALYMRKSSTDTDRRDTNVFAEADRVFEDELARARIDRNTSALGAEKDAVTEEKA